MPFIKSMSISKPSTTEESIIDSFLTTKEVGQFLSLSCGTLARMRRYGLGPFYYRLTSKNVQYKLSDVLAWAEDGRTAPYRRLLANLL